MRPILTAIAVTVFALFALLTLYIYSFPTVDFQPKPSHHVVLFEVCGTPVGLLVTLKPPVWVSPDFPVSDEVGIVAAEAIHAGRTSLVNICSDVPARR